MSRGPRTAHRKDRNHDAIVDVFVRGGLDVLSLTEVGGGAPDALLHFAGRFALVEVKAGNARLRPDQEAFRLRWPVRVVRTLEEAAVVVRVLREGM